MNILVKKLHEDAVLPTQATPLDAGYDLVAIDSGEVKLAEEDNKTVLYIQYRTGISIQPPSGYHTEIFPRSSVTNKTLILGNSIGLVDEGYRGEILVRFKPTCDIWGSGYRTFGKGDKIAQLVIRKTERAQFVWNDELEDSQRGEGGFGSSGN